jgi:hypothetical protein
MGALLAPIRHNMKQPAPLPKRVQPSPDELFSDMPVYSYDRLDLVKARSTLDDHLPQIKAGNHSIKATNLFRRFVYES